MRPPQDRGAQINTRRIRRWETEYGSYRHSVTASSIREWIDQFGRGDRDTAARILDSLEYYGSSRLASLFRQLLQSLNGWDPDPSRRVGRWFFVPYTISSGESGDSMVHQFRLANNLTHRRFNECFIYKSELQGKGLTENDCVVFVDDLTGSGRQVCDAWDQDFSEIVVGAGRVYLGVAVAGETAFNRITQDTGLTLVAGHRLDSSDDFYSNDCRFFSAEEKEKILKYSKRLDRTYPRGFGDCGYLLVFQHRCPNNSLPILHVNSAHWTALFPRHDE